MEPSSTEPLLWHIIPLIGQFPLGGMLSLLLLMVLLCCSALVSGSEVAYFSLSPKQLLHLNKINTKKRSKRVLALLENPNKLLATILIANNFINVGIIVLSSFLLGTGESKGTLFDLTSFSDLSVFLIQVVIVTFLVLLLGEVVPKVYATRYNLTLAKFMSASLMVLSSIFSPFSSLLLRATNIIDKRIKRKRVNISVDELEHAIDLTVDENTSVEEQKILRKIVKFGNTDVKQVMTPRTDVIALDKTIDLKEVITTILESGFSRIPMYNESFDAIEGILYIKDLLPYHHRKKFDWNNLTRDAYFVPENKKIDDLLREFQERKIHMAIVVDEYGGTSGLITLEDILEEIVGDITDEFDEDHLNYLKVDEENYIFEGKTPLIDLYRVLEIDGSKFEAQKGESDTLAGFILEQAGKIPLKNEKIAFENYRFTIEAADRRKIKQVKLTILPQNEEE